MKTELLIAGLLLGALPSMQLGKAQEPPENAAVSAFSELRSVDLILGRRLRMCLHRIEPGGTLVIPAHRDRPAVSYVLQGTMISRQAGMQDKVLHVGDGLTAAPDGPAYRLMNNSEEPVEFVEVDLFRP